jgi:hypothetical protein
VDGGTVVLMPWFLWPMRVFAAGVLAAATLPLGWQAYRASFVAYADSDNPYVYVPTLPAVAKFETDIGQLLDVYQGQDQPQAAVVWHDAYYWPIPWYLRSAESVGYWMDPEQFAAAVQGVPPPPIVICSPQRDAAVTRVLDKSHVMIGFYGIRSNVLALVWVRMDLWEAHLRRLGRI